MHGDNFVDGKHVKLCGTIIWKYMAVFKFIMAGLCAGRVRERHTKLKCNMNRRLRRKMRSSLQNEEVDTTLFLSFPFCLHPFHSPFMLLLLASIFPSYQLKICHFNNGCLGQIVHRFCNVMNSQADFPPYLFYSFAFHMTCFSCYFSKWPNETWSNACP